MWYTHKMTEKINNQIQNYYNEQADRRSSQVRTFSQEVIERNKEIKTTRLSAVAYRALGGLMLVGAGYSISKGNLETAAVFGVGGVGMAGFGEFQSKDARKQQKELNKIRTQFRRDR